MTDLTREEYHKQMQRLRSVPASPEKPHRHTLADAYRDLQESFRMVLNRSSHDSESVEISRNAKGQFQFSVTVRTSEGETIEQAFDRGSAVVGQLVARFPYTENGGA